MSKWISLSVALLAIAVSTPAQAELFGRFGQLITIGPAQHGVVQSEVMTQPLMTAPQKYGGPVQSGGYPFVGGCCEAKTPCCGSVWSGFCGKGPCSYNRMHSWFGARSCGSKCGTSCGPKFGGSCAQKGAPCAQKGPAPCAQKSHAPCAQKGAACRPKCGTGCRPRFNLWTPKFRGGCAQKGAPCGPTCGAPVIQKGATPCAQKGAAYGKGSGSMCGHVGLFGRLHARRGCGTPACGKGAACNSCGGGMNWSYGAPTQGFGVPAPAAVDPVPAPAPVDPAPVPAPPAVPEKSAGQVHGNSYRYLSGSF